MKYPFVFLLLLLASAGFGIDRNAFTFTHYNLDVRVEPEQQRLAVRGRITLRNDSSSPQKNAALQVSSSLDWRSIQVEGKAVQFVSQPYTSDIDHTGAVSEAIVTLPVAIPPKGTVDLDIGYEGVIPLDTTRLKRIGVPDDIAKHSDWDQISPSFTAVRGVGYVAWYPVAMDAANLSEENSEFDLISAWKNREQQAGAQINLCVISDADQTALMNDQRNGPRTVGVSGTTNNTAERCGRHVFPVMGITVPAIAIGPFQTVTIPGANIIYAADADSGAKNYAAAAARIVPLIRGWFGDPHTAMDIVQLADSDAAPFETGTIMFTPFNADSRLAEISVVHVLVHSAYLSPRPWSYEGLAHFAQALWREHEAGRQAALDFMGLHRTALEKVEQKPSSASLITATDEEIYRSKAMFVWSMLRDMIGEPALKKALASYRAADDRHPEYMPRLIQAQTSRDLHWFFDDWVYHDRGLPDFTVASVFPSKTPRGIYLVTVTIENLGNAGAEVPFTVHFNGGEVTNRLEVRARARATTRIEVPAMPTEVIVNDGSVPESNTGNNTFRVGGDNPK